MLEALWSVEFLSNAGNVGNFGAGVVVLETQRVFGGDSNYFYVGNYEYNVGTHEVTANLEVTHYAGQPHSIFGSLTQFHLELVGVAARAQFEFQGLLVEQPALLLRVKMIRRAELP